jgi:uncharacterized surface protein with fasciclin (FAS1) repeats
MSEQLNLIEKLQNDRKFSTFAKAIDDAGISDTLKGSGPFTILAPTNEAFNKVPGDTMISLEKPENKSKFAELLNYHIIPGKIMSDEIAKLTTAKTLQGREVKIDTTNGIKIDDSKLQARNIKATNGVIHAIDTVLAPAAAAKMS